MRLLFVTAGSGFAPGLRAKWALQDTIIKNLERRGIECMRIDSARYRDRLPLSLLNTARRRRFERHLDEFGPDAVILDAPYYMLGPAVSRRKIPLLVYFWDDWMNRRMAREEGQILPRLRMAAQAFLKRYCLKRATVILAETGSISDVIRRHYPESRVATFPYSSIDTDCWRDGNRGDAMDLRHPCVGLLQYADWWPKTREMLVLPKVMEALPHVTFYWAGDGKHRDRVLAALSRHDNFRWLGALEYPDKVIEYLSSIDIYGLASGNEMSPYSMKMAMSVERPVIATDIGGVSDTMQDERTGFVVKQGDYGGWVEKISLLLNDPAMAQDMGRSGRKFVQDNWDSGVAAERLVGILEEIRQR